MYRVPAAQTSNPLIATLMKHFRFLFSIVLCVISMVVSGQDYSNKGKDFWIAYTGHIDATSSRMALYISSDVNTTGEVQLAGTTIPFTVTANQATTVQISPRTYPVYNGQSDGTNTGYGIHVVSAAPVVVYAHILNAARSGSTLVLPTNVLGREYIALAYQQSVNAQNTAKSQITVVGVEDNTVVEINPVAASVNNSKPANTPFQVSLNKGDVYQYQSFSDLTGSSIKSISGSGLGCKPIAVFTGSSWTSFDCSGASGGDNLYQQLFPTPSWGKNFVTAPFAKRQYDIFRIIVKDPTTVVTLNGSTLNAATLINNQYYEFNSSTPNQVSADKPVEVIQYMTSQTCDTRNPVNCNSNCPYPGDPEIVTINPLEQTVNNVTVVSARYDLTPPNTNITAHYLNIIMKTTGTSGLLIDNAAPGSAWIPIANTGFSYLQEDVTASTNTNPSHNIKAGDGFICIAYGMGNVESYGYNAGTNVKDFTPAAVFQNPYNRIDSAVTCVNSPFQFAVPLSFEPQTIKWDFSQAPNITPNTSIGPLTSFSYDTVRTVNGSPLYYYSTHNTYTFSKSNTAALRDTIKLYTTTTTPDGCGSNDQVYSIPVTVKELPVAKFSVTTAGCVTDSVYFSDASSFFQGSIYEWNWDYGDGSTDKLFSVQVKPKVYLAQGSYTIKLTAISDIGCISPEVSQVVVKNTKPVAHFTISDPKCVNTDIVFTDGSTNPGGAIAKWIWDLGDGKGAVTNTTNAAITTQYTSEGTKQLSLKVETPTGCQSDPYTPAMIINPQPVPGFTLPEVCLSDAFARFTDTSHISDGSEAQFKWLWNFNAGTPAVSPGPSVLTSTLQNPQVKYNKSDNYSVSLSVTSKDGCTAGLVQNFTVNGTNPEAAFRILSPQPYCGTKQILVKDSSTVDFGKVTRLEIYWDDINQPNVMETDEDPYVGKIYTHSYPDPQLSTPQTYTIRWVAYSGGTSCVNTATQTITVYPQPKAAFSVSATRLCSGTTVSFQDQGNGVSSAATNWAWTLGGNTVSGSQNPVKQFTDSGLFTISMYFYNADGCISDTAQKQITVFPNPVLDLQHNATVLSGGVYTIKPVFVYGSQLQYLWTPATYLSSDTAATPVTMPDDDITYRLTLTAEGGCTASDTIFIKVLKGPEVPNAFSPNGDGINDTWRIKNLESYPGSSVKVYNRYGQIVFQSTGYSVDWDGTYQGKALPVGTYYYIINPRNGRSVISGSVTIIK